MKVVRKDVCHVWAHQLQTHSRSGNTIHEHDTIYSYGHHFPMARHAVGTRKRKCILVTTRGYSNTTAKHLCEVRRSIPPDVPVFYVPDVMADSKPDYVKAVASYRERIEATEKQISKAKSRLPLVYDALCALVAEANAFCDMFGIRTRFAVSDAESIKARVVEVEKKNEEARRTAEARRIAKAAKALAKWKAGEPVTVPYLGRHYMRIVGDMVETTLRAEVPIEHVRRAAPQVLRIIRSGESWVSNGHTIHLGHYSLSQIDADGTVHVGCHVFERSEIERIAELLKAE